MADNAVLQASRAFMFSQGYHPREALVPRRRLSYRNLSAAAAAATASAAASELRFVSSRTLCAARYQARARPGRLRLAPARAPRAGAIQSAGSSTRSPQARRLRYPLGRLPLLGRKLLRLLEEALGPLERPASPARKDERCGQHVVGALEWLSS